MKKSVFWGMCILVLTLLLNACSPAATPPSPPVMPTSNPDPCAPENLPGEVKKVNALMREFDDASALASSTPQESLGSVVSDLQRIRREAEDLEAPACLLTLKKYQLAHMNLVINTMLAFMNGAGQQAVADGINQARVEHDLYTVELARLLGITLVPATAVPLVPVTTSTPIPVTVTPTP